MPVEELGLETMAIGEQASYLQPFSWRQFTVAFVGPWLPVPDYSVARRGFNFFPSATTRSLLDFKTEAYRSPKT